LRKILESIRIALQSLLANKLRAALTLVGVIIGVTTVITVVSVINGMNDYVAREINSIGATTFIVDKYGIITSDDEWIEAQKRKDLTFADLEAVERYCPHCGLLSGSVYTRRRVKFGEKYLSDVDIVGTDENYIEVSDVDIDYGRGFIESDVDHTRAVAIVGPEVVENLLPVIDPIGRNIKVEDYFLRIIGVGKKRGSFLGMNKDNWVALPRTTFEKYFGSRRSVEIRVKAASLAAMQVAEDEARMILRSRRGVKYNDKDDFAIYTAEAGMEFFRSFSSAAFFAMIGISSIALIVGGIVIMNIMLVSVTERTREVGIRKAIGARRRDILWQFLVESVTLAGVGGVIGVVLGVILAALLSQVTPLPASVKVWSIVVGIAISSAVGIFFGVFPAVKAARLNPIEALRYE
jgi:putative ABC transport system permease protein